MPRFDPSEPELPEHVLFETVFPATESARVEMIETIIAKLVEHRLIDPDDFANKARLCIDEALINAVVHGSGRDASREVGVKLTRDDHTWAIQFTDDGVGFKETDLPNYDDPEWIAESEGGRGLLLIDAYMDDCCYYGRGNVCVMRKAVFDPSITPPAQRKP